MTPILTLTLITRLVAAMLRQGVPPGETAQAMLLVRQVEPTHQSGSYLLRLHLPPSEMKL
jgi:hypothetical protein